MICLTGDVHHMSLQTNDQKYLSGRSITEVQVARRYVELVEAYGVKCTLYICGRCFTEEWEDLEAVATHPLVEVGGHTFNARFPRECFDAYGEKTGLWNGPRWYQEWDIRRNIESALERTGYAIRSWRAHSYMVDRNTHELLAAHGVRLVSDNIEASTFWPKRIEYGLISHPINCIPDHDHLYHAHRTHKYVEEANRIGYGADEFGAVSYPIEEWGRLVVSQAVQIDDAGGVATILAHPICMYLADGFATFEVLLRSIASRRTIWAREIANLVDNPSAAGPKQDSYPAR